MMISVRVGLLPLALVIAANVASAGIITFTESVTATGSLGSTPFTGALVTLTAFGDTSNVTNPDPSNGLFELSLPADTVSISIAGLDTAILTDAADVFSNENSATLDCPAVGISDAFTDDIVDTNGGGVGGCSRVDNPFDTYALTTSIGPFTGLTGGNLGATYDTDLGVLEFSALAELSTFAATTGTSTPEPSTMALFGFGMTGLAALKCRK
jgi:hypothetical protein